MTYGEWSEDARVCGGCADRVDVGTAAGRRTRTPEDERSLRRVDVRRRQRELVLESDDVHARSAAVVSSHSLHVCQPLRHVYTDTQSSQRCHPHTARTCKHAF